MSLKVMPLQFWNSSRYGDSATALRSLFQDLTILLGKKIVPHVQPKLQVADLEAASSCPITCYSGEETTSYLASAFFQCVVGEPGLLSASFSSGL